VKYLSIISFVDTLKLNDPIYIDMRSPTEYQSGCIPGAVNIPLFDDVERGEVGLIYKSIGAEEANHLGLELVSPKLPEIVQQIREYFKTGRPLIIYCWRGGMRSKAVVSVLELVGISAYQLIGGYKSFRRFILDSLDNLSSLPPIVVLCGPTGVGKTLLLSRLATFGIPVIDLEKLANHRGSVFGQIGLGKPQTAQNFDAVLFYELEHLKNAPYIVVECESKRIGNVYIPNIFHQAMQQGKRILAFASMECRVSRLIDEYCTFYHDNKDVIAASLATLSGRLGKVKTQKLLDAFAADEVHDVIHTLLIDYYDPLYGYDKTPPEQFDYLVDAESLEEATTRIIEYLNRLRG